MKKLLFATAAVSSLLTISAMWCFGLAALPSKVTLENKRVKVRETTYPPGVPRERYVRPTDQVIVFLDNCRYQRTDSKTGEKTVRERRAGEVIWHDKGEDAPVLVNLGSKPYRTLTIELL
ncbi:MAG: hypothetical protein WD696_18590 [Bryobacteraceae bacterium]